MGDSFTQLNPGDRSLLEEMGQHSPVAAMLANAADPFLSRVTGYSVHSMMSPLGQRTDAYRFSGMDARVLAGFTDPYGAGLYGETTGTFVGDALKRGWQDIAQGNRLAAEAHARSVRQAGALYSFAASRGMDQRMLGADFTHRASVHDVNALFAKMTGASMPLGPLTRGERASVVERMTGMDATRGLATIQLGGETTLDSGKLSTLRANLSGMESALSDWKTVLGQDLPRTLKALADVFGGDVVSMFASSARTFQAQALGMRHAASIAGVGIGDVLGNASAIGKAVVGYGGSAATSLGLGTAVTAYGAGLGPGMFMATPDTVKRGLVEMAAQSATSEGSMLVAGAFSAWRNQPGRVGLTTQQAMAEFNKAIEGIDGGDISAGSLGRALGMEMGRNELYRHSKSQDAALYSAQNAERYSMYAMESISKSYFEAYQTMLDPAMAGRVAGMGADEFYRVMSLGTDERRKALLAKGFTEEQAGALAAGNETIHERLKRLPWSGATALGEDTTSADMLNAMRMVPEGRARMREARARAEMDARMTTGGSRIRAAIDMLATDDTVSAATLFKVATGLDMVEAVPGLDNLSKEVVNQALAKMEDLEKGMQAQGRVADLSKRVPAMFEQLREAVATGDDKRAAQVKAAISGATGLVIGKDGGITYDDKARADYSKAAEMMEEVLRPVTAEEAQTRTQQALARAGVSSSADQTVAGRALDIKKAALLSTTTDPGGRATLVAALKGLEGTASEAAWVDTQLEGDARAGRAAAKGMREAGISGESMMISALISQLEAMLKGLFETTVLPAVKK